MIERTTFMVTKGWEFKRYFILNQVRYHRQKGIVIMSTLFSYFACSLNQKENDEFSIAFDDSDYERMKQICIRWENKSDKV
jgi:hypothetical protein